MVLNGCLAKTRQSRVLSLYAALLAAIVLTAPGFANGDGRDTVSPLPVKTEADAGGNGAKPPVLTGGVVQIDVGLNDLRDARLSVSRARKAVANLYDEMTRQQVVMNYNPNLVGTTVIMTPMPTFTGQYLPARTKWVRASMDEIGPIIKLLNDDVDAAIENNRHIDASEPTRQALAPIREQAFGSVKQSFALYQQLEKMTGGAVYDQPAIAQASQSLDKEMKSLDRSLKKGISILQKEAKQAKKNKSTTGV